MDDIVFILSKEGVEAYPDAGIREYREHQDNPRNDELDISYFSWAIQALKNVGKELCGETAVP